MKTHYLILVFLLITACSSPKNNSEETAKLEEQPEEIAEVPSEEASDEMVEPYDYTSLIDTVVANARGIEQIFLQLNPTVNNVKTLFKYKKDSRLDRLKNIENYENIRVINPYTGYLISESGESISYLTYWKLNNKTKLVAKVTRGCGPVCEDELKFYRIENDKPVELDLYDVIKSNKKIEEVLIDDWANWNDPNPLAYNLPQMGKNILVCIQPEMDLLHKNDAELESKGRCIELIFNDGTFAMGEITNNK